MCARVPRRGRRRLVLAAVAVLGAAVACNPSWTALAAGQLVEVAQKGRAFAVPEAEVPVGGTVRFTNEDDFPHQVVVTGPGMRVDSPLQSSGQAIDVPFPAAGTFAVRCGVHPRMRMSIHVQ